MSSTSMSAVVISPDRVLVEPPTWPRIRESRYITCRECGASVETCLDDIHHYERDRDADANGEYLFYEVYRCPNRGCRADVPDVIYEPTPLAQATRIGF